MRILFQGDSITDGNRIKNNTTDLNHQIGHSYVYPSVASLMCYSCDKGYECLNRGVSGNRVLDLYSRIKPDFLDLAPDVCSILVGVNDFGWMVHNLDSFHGEMFDFCYRHLLDLILEKLPDCRLILCEPFYLPVEGMSEDLAAHLDYMARLQDIVKKIAEDYRTVFVPLQKRFEQAVAAHGPTSYWLWDGVHPTEAGHQLLADAWMEAAKKNGILETD